MAIDPEAVAGQGPDVPDHVPDDLVERFGREAGELVRYTRSPRYRVSTQVRDAARTLGDTNVWSLAVMIFFWMIVASAIVGSLVYAVVLRPWIGAFVVVPVVAMFGIAVLAAVRATRRPASEGDRIVCIP